MNTNLLKQKFNTKFETIHLIKALFWITFFGGLFAKALYFQFTSEINTLPFFNKLNLFMYIGTIGALLAIASFFILVSNRKRYLVFILLHFAVSLFILADTIYFRYYYHPLSITVLYQVGVADSIGGSALSLFKMKDIVFIADLPVIVTCFVLINKKVVGRISIGIKFITAVLLLLAGLFMVHTSYSKAYKPAFILDNNYVCKYVGLSFYHFYDTKNFVKETFLEGKKLSTDEQKRIDNYYKIKNTSRQENFKNLAKGKNLIIIQVEALQEFVIRKQINGQEITPNLNKLIKESAYFNNFFYQIGDGNTSDAEFMVNTSMYPIRHGSVNFRYAGNTFISLPGLLNRQGYDTLAFHANRPSFWNRSTMYKSLGFKAFHSNPSYTLDEKVGWGLSDASFLSQSLKLIDTSKPFYSLLITLSSHFPYNFDYSSRSSLDVGKYENTLLGRYLKAVNYSDSCLGSFINELKSKGLFSSSLLVIYGDHYGIPKEETKDLAEFLNIKNSDTEWIKLQKVPLIIHYPGLENGNTFSVTGGEIDIMPTVANLMGLNSSKAIGKDLFNTKAGYALLRNNSLVTDKFLYVNSHNKAYDINTGSPYTDESYKVELKNYMEEYAVSQLIIEKNAFKSKE
ncbi:MAG: LTA synthase family protein [Clostridia bacterium]|nr:LTA synthase family protein [Clostridia bacterium]